MVETLASKKDKLFFFSALTVLLFLKFWEDGLGISTITYGALASDILETGNWLTFRLGDGIYEPFVDHPPLALWIDAIIFKLMGVSPQSIRLLGIISCLGVFYCLWSVNEKLYNSRTVLPFL